MCGFLSPRGPGVRVGQGFGRLRIINRIRERGCDAFQEGGRGGTGGFRGDPHHCLPAKVIDGRALPRKVSLMGCDRCAL